MATNDELKKGSDLLKDQVTEVGFLDNAFKTLSATISSAIDAAIDDMQGLDDVTQKVDKSYQRDITSSINKATKGLEDQVDLTVKIQKGQNVGKELTSKIERNEARRQLTLKKISNLENAFLGGNTTLLPDKSKFSREDFFSEKDDKEDNTIVIKLFFIYKYFSY